MHKDITAQTSISGIVNGHAFQGKVKAVIRHGAWRTFLVRILSSPAWFYAGHPGQSNVNHPPYFCWSQQNRGRCLELI